MSVNKNKELNRTSKDEEKEKKHNCNYYSFIKKYYLTNSYYLVYKQQKESSINDFQRIRNLNDNKESVLSKSHGIHTTNNQYAMKIKETSQKLDLSNSNANPFGEAGSFGGHSHKFESQNNKLSKNSEFNRSKISDNSKPSYNRKDSDIITPKRIQGKKHNDSDDGSSFLSNFDELKSPLKNQNTKQKAIEGNFLDGGVSGIKAEMDSFNDNTESNAAMLQFIHAVS